MISVIGITFTDRNKIGDFVWMCTQSEYNDSLFIFNDNEERHNSNVRGKGNAVMRQYNKYSNLTIPKSAGIPTGTFKNHGYKKLDDHCKKIIDNAIDEIIELIHLHHYKRIFYSADENGKLGTNLFIVGDDVTTYITGKLNNLKNI